MPGTHDRSDVQLDVQTGATHAAPRPLEDTPFRIAFMGDFSGRASRGVKRAGDETAAGRAWEIDRDNLDEVMERLGVELEVPVAGRIRFESLDDFHPDSLYGRLEMFRKLERARSQTGQAAPPQPPPVSRDTGRTPDMSLGGLLDQAVEETASAAEGRPAGTKDDFREWLDEKVAPHTEAAPDPQALEVERLVHQVATAQMRALMHFPAFQELEAAWRAVDFLVRRVDTDSLLKIFLIDITKQELSAGLRSATDLGDAGIVQLLGQQQDSGGWALLCGNYTFGPEVEDIALLARLGRIGQALDAPFIAAASPRLAGTDSLLEHPDPRHWQPSPETWEKLRQHPAASSVGLLLPRFLLRLPYGAGSSPCDRFPFEEQEEPPEHGRYLWGNPAAACACLLAESFSASGWDLRPGERSNLTRLPLHSYKSQGETINQPCAETTMSERTAAALAERGLMALASIRDSDEIRLVRFQSAADPPTQLRGRW